MRSSETARKSENASSRRLAQQPKEKGKGERGQRERLSAVASDEAVHLCSTFAVEALKPGEPADPSAHKIANDSANGAPARAPHHDLEAHPAKRYLASTGTGIEKASAMKKPIERFRGRQVGHERQLSS